MAEEFIDNPLQSYLFDEAKSSKGREYFSGANARVYFGDVWVDQLSDISFAMQEQVAPIYGFRSYTFDRISRGSRHVEGEFTVNFTENGYLQTILESIALGMDERSQELEAGQQRTSYLRNLSEEQNIRDILELGRSNNGGYKEQIEALKDSFWGKPSATIASSQKKEQDVFYYGERNGETSILREHGFNILIDYSPDANHRDFQDCLDGTKNSKSFYQSFRTIVGVQITGEEQVIGNNGAPIQTRYRFLARDLDADVTKPSLWSNYRNTSPTVINWNRPSNGVGGGGNQGAHHLQ